MQAREKGAEPPVMDRVEGQGGHPLDTPPVLSVDTPEGQGGQGRDTLEGQVGTPSRDRLDTLKDTPPVPVDRAGTPPGHPGTPSKDRVGQEEGHPPVRGGHPGMDTPDTPLSGKTRTRWKEAYREVFGEVDGLFEARVRRAMGLMERGEARSRVEALEAVRPWSPDHELDPLVGGPDGRPVEAGRILPPEPEDKQEQGGKSAPPGSDEPETSSVFPSSVENQNRARTRWREAYRTVFGEEPDGQLAEARMRAALNFYDPERSVGRRQALEAVRASEEEAASRTREAERVFEPDNHAPDEEPEGEWLPLPGEDALTLGAALMKIGRLEAEVEELRRAVARLEAGLHRTETRLGGMSPGLRALREAVREARDLTLKLSARVDTLAPASSSEEKSLPPGKKELRELRARMDEERGRILLEVENRLEEAEELMRRSTENRIAALESWVRRVSRYLGIGKKGGFFR
ncbi:hypothetical protein [Meiothermus ruber]|uniref:hypothetical protein n=1 Tax=Meiothermus ruber TaxID=277 RepID=UPI002286186E|nr:hypothetical protein [Meiothermus ruber]